jgi:Icc-related predicted phosphoesterase
LRLLIFSDVHNDWKTLEHLLSVDADYYIAAGDQVTWSKGIERCGEILSARGDKVYVLPGNHESAEQVAAMCARHGLHDFHGRHFQAGRWHVAGLGYSNPTPFNTPGEYSEPQIADRLARFAELDPLVLE